MHQLRLLRDAHPGVREDLSHLAGQLTVERARTFANEALGRRLPVIQRAVLNVFRMFPPDRREFLSNDECTDVSIQLHAFAINVYALFDNIAWICVLEAGVALEPTQIGAFKQRCQGALPPELRAYLSEPRVKDWFNNYGKVYRDSTAHRIPPYLPPRVMTAEEGERWRELNEASMRILLDYQLGESHDQATDRLARHDRLEKEKHALGQNSIMMGLSLTGEDATRPVYLHPQLLCDWGLVHELVQAFTKAMRTQRGWPAPTIPPMVVRGPI
jgi:hypothetical protein